VGGGIGGHHSPKNKTDVWLTPFEIVRALGSFDLDPCGAPSPRPYDVAADTIELPRDGLSEPWGGRVWLNPPYSDVARWMSRLAEHGHGTALVFARTDTKWWHDVVFAKATAVKFLRGRPAFYRADGTRAAHNCGGPLALVAFGEEDAVSLRSKHVSVRGVIARLSRRQN